MPLGLWESPAQVERVPLSSANEADDDDEEPLPSYSDIPPPPLVSGDSNNGDSESNARGSNSNGSNGRSLGTRKNKAHKAITIQEETQFLQRDYGDEYTYDDDDDGFGAGDYYSSINTGNGGGGKKKRYRGLLIWAYLRHCLTCGCCCSSSSARSGGNSKCSCFRGMTRMAWMLFYICILIIIMLCASGIGYIIAQDGNPFSPDEVAGAKNSGSSSSPESKHILGNSKNKNILPSPPDNLYEVCNDWITPAGREQCTKMCEVAECCTYPSTDKNNCRENQAEECATYRSACMAMELHMDDANDDGGTGAVGSTNDDDDDALSGTVALYPPPDFLPQICSPASLNTPQGFESCSKKCKPSRCCHPEKYDCTVADKKYCDSYEKPCATVAETWRGSGHAVATTGDATSGDAGGGEQNSIANDVMLKCNSANINPPDSCIEACYEAACCYVTNTFPPIEELFDKKYGVDKNPIRTVSSCASNVGFCQQYGSCEHLNNLKDTSGWHSDDYTYELDIEGVCRAEYIAQFGALECSNVCQPAHCCFSQEYACDDVQLGHLKCDDYQKCGVLYPSKKSMKELLQLAEQIDEVCSEESMSTLSGRSECQQQCKGRLCCFDTGAYGCANDPSQNCLAYAGCETLVDTPQTYIDNEQIINANKPVDSNIVESSADENMGVKDMDADEFTLALKEACSPESLKTIEGLTMCHNKCQTHLCCFTKDVVLSGEDCSNHYVDACDAYKPCELLVSPDYSQSQPTSQNPYDVEKAVKDACTLPQNPLLITPDWIAGCHGICASRFCCLVDSRIGSSCIDTLGENECSKYDVCDVLINDNGGEVTDINQLQSDLGSVESVCNSQVTSDQTLHAACEERCESRSCCFEPEPAYSCYFMEQGWCDEFKSCEYIGKHFYLDSVQANQGGDISSGGSTQAESTVKDMDSAEFKFVLEEACSTESLKTLSGIERCYDKCQAHLCCFRGDSAIEAVDGCADEYVEECTAYSPCRNLILLENAWEPPASWDSYDVKLSVTQACAFPKDNAPITPEWTAECHRMCAPRLCCLTDISTDSNCVDVLGQDECDSYGSCQDLVGGDLKESESIEDLCNSNVLTDTTLHAACESRCDVRACCFQEAPYSCYEMEKEWCREYESCGYVGLEFRPGTHVSNTGTSTVENQYNTPPPPSPISAPGVDKSLGSSSNADESQTSFSALCQPSNLGKNWNPCRSHCAPYECCFESNPNDSCYNNDKAKCDEYAICNEFYGGTNPGLESSGVSSSGVESPSIANNGGIAAPTSNSAESSFSALCQPSNLGKNWNPCKSHCEPYECCFAPNPNDSCYNNDKAKCDEYAICKEFFVDTPGVTTSSGSSSISGPSSVANSGFSADTQDDMESLCNLNLDQNLDACKSWCLPYECCFTFSNSCMSSQPQECDDHAICNDVFDALKRNPNSATGGVTPVSNNAQDNTFSSNAVSNPVSINNSPQVPAQNSAQTAVQDLAESELISLAKACNDDQLEINDSECLRICQGSACCFDAYTPRNCSNQPTMEAFCRDHSICSSVFNR